MSSTTELEAWLNGTATGGPLGNGRYPMTYKDGQVHMIKSPAAQSLDPNIYPLSLSYAGSAPDAFTDQAYSYSYAINGGIAPYTAVVNAIPTGLSAAISGALLNITGNPTVVESNAFINITLSDGLGESVVVSDVIDVFSPASLFAANEQGAWYDPSDFSTTFQDSAGTTPVTAVEQPVGLILDKRLGLVRGAELISNGTFATDSAGWVASASASVSAIAGRLRVSAAADFGGGSTSFPTTIGKAYEFLFDAWKGTSSTFRVEIGFGAGESNNYNSFNLTADSPTRTVIFVATHSTTFVTMRVDNAGTYAEIDNVSVREIPGNHATQVDAGKRPVLSARKNLLLQTENLTDAATQRAYGTVTGGQSAPDGSNTAFLFQASSTICGWDNYPTDYGVSQYVTQKASIYAKAGTTDVLTIGSASGTVTFNLTSGTLISTYSSPINTAIESVGGGWFRVEIVFIKSNQYHYFTAYADNASFASDKSIYLWHPDVRPYTSGDNSPRYQRVNTDTDYDTVGFPHYLKFDGVDDCLSGVSNIIAANDPMDVFAGLKAVGDQAIYSFLCNGTSDSAHVFLDGNNYAYTDGLVHNLQTTIAQATPAPHVVSFQVSVGTTPLYKFNGSSVATNTFSAIARSGNNGFYIGRREIAGSFYSGNIYQLIIRGASSSADQITAAETYVNSKTGAY